MTALAYSGAIRTPVPKRRATTRRGQGRLEQVLPTLELLRHKAIVLGGRINNKGSPVGFDPHSSVQPLDVYLARQVIEARHHKAGTRYAQDRFALYGQCAPRPAGAWREFIPEQIGDDDEWRELTDADRHAIDAERAKRLRDATELLGTGEVRKVVRLVVLDGAFVPCAEYYLLRIGLDALADAWRIRNDE